MKNNMYFIFQKMRSRTIPTSLGRNTDLSAPTFPTRYNPRLGDVLDTPQGICSAKFVGEQSSHSCKLQRGHKQPQRGHKQPLQKRWYRPRKNALTKHLNCVMMYWYALTSYLFVLNMECAVEWTIPTVPFACPTLQITNCRICTPDAWHNYAWIIPWNWLEMNWIRRNAYPIALPWPLRDLLVMVLAAA